MNLKEFTEGFDRLERNFGTQGTDKARFLYEELRQTEVRAWNNCIQAILDSEARFPVLATFRKHLFDQKPVKAVSTLDDSPSCSRCTHGIATVKRIISMRPATFTFRCECPSGDRYPGLPLVSSEEQTVKEAKTRPNYPVPSPPEQRRIIANQLELVGEVI